MADGGGVLSNIGEAAAVLTAAAAWLLNNWRIKRGENTVIVRLMAELDNERKDRESERARWGTERESLRSDLDASEGRERELQAAMNRMHLEFVQFREDMGGLRVKIDTVTRQNEDLLADNRDLKAQNQELRNEIRTLMGAK